MNKHLSHKKADDRDPSVRALEEDWLIKQVDIRVHGSLSQDPMYLSRGLKASK